MISFFGRWRAFRRWFGGTWFGLRRGRLETYIAVAPMSQGWLAKQRESKQ